MRKTTIAVLILLILSGIRAPVVGQDKPSDDSEWPSLAPNSKIMVPGGGPLFIIDERKLQSSSDVNNPLDVERCRASESCKIDVSDFFSNWSRQYGIEKSILRSDVVMHHYPYVGLHRPMREIYVFFLPTQKVFYLWGDCQINHWDGVRGPFAGNPKVVLKKLAEEASAQ